MISALILSLNRPMQLDLLVRSLLKNAPEKLFHLVVLYKATTPEYQKGYDRVFSKFKSHFVLPMWETNFREDVLFQLKFWRYDYFSFFTDDSVMFRKLDLTPSEVEENLCADTCCLSLRLGLNTIVQDQYSGRCQPPLRNYQDNGKFLKWRHRDYGVGFNNGYCYSLDAHIYRRADMVKWCSQIDFDAPNPLENNLYKVYDQSQTYISSLHHSSVITIPNNRSQNIFPNRAGEIYGVSLEELNNRYLDGEIIDLDTIMATQIDGTHKEIPYLFKKG